MGEDVALAVIAISLFVASLVFQLGCAEPDDGIPRTYSVQPSGPPKDNKQIRALKSAGYSNIQLTGAALFTCGDRDSLLASSTFEATGPVGNRVSGSVCCGLMLKGCTVRF